MWFDQKNLFSSLRESVSVCQLPIEREAYDDDDVYKEKKLIKMRLSWVNKCPRENLIWG